MTSGAKNLAKLRKEVLNLHNRVSHTHLSNIQKNQRKLEAKCKKSPSYPTISLWFKTAIKLLTTSPVNNSEKIADYEALKEVLIQTEQRAKMYESKINSQKITITEAGASENAQLPKQLRLT